jgi:hypothetical protein
MLGSFSFNLPISAFMNRLKALSFFFPPVDFAACINTRDLTGDKVEDRRHVPFFVVVGFAIGVTVPLTPIILL